MTPLIIVVLLIAAVVIGVGVGLSRRERLSKEPRDVRMARAEAQRKERRRHLPE